MTPVGDVDLILASGSRYRAELLARIAPRFRQVSAQTDEAPRPGEAALELVARLARAKADAVAAAHPGSVVIGSDQVAELDGAAMGKPGSRDAAIAQLTAMSGREVVFRTALSLAHGDGRRLDEEDVTTVRFRRLDAGEIARYIDAEAPLDSAGSFKSEGLGIALFDAIESRDPTALVGLPLIATTRLLRKAGFRVP